MQTDHDLILQNSSQARQTFNPTAAVFSPPLASEQEQNFQASSRSQSRQREPDSYPDARTQIPYPVPGVPPPAPAMSSSPPGGLIMGGRLIEFGDFPDPLDTDLARERAERLRAEADTDKKAFVKKTA